MEKLNNAESTGVRIGAMTIVLGLLMMIIPTAIEMDMMQWGYGLGFIGFFLTIVGFVIYRMYKYRETVTNELFTEANLLAHWQYDRATYEKQIEREFADKKALHSMLLKIVLFFFFTITAIFLIFGFSYSEDEERLLFTITMASIAAIISFAAYISPFVMRNKALSVNSDTYISTKGLYYNGYLHTWNKPFAMIKKVSIENGNLVFAISYLTKLGWIKYETYRLKILIPKGEEATAKEIISKLTL
jgi:magnesium-transporting ATPase (P-type)